MADSYTTVSGDAWDSVAKKIYGDVKYTEYFMSQNKNKELLATVIFDSGVVLQTPSLPSTIITALNQPPWR